MSSEALSQPTRVNLMGEGEGFTGSVAAVLRIKGTFDGSRTICFQAIPGDFWGDVGMGRVLDPAEPGRESVWERGASEPDTRRSTLRSEPDERCPGL